MKLLEFKCIKSDSETWVGVDEYFVLLESEEEKDCYHWTHDRMDKSSYYEGYWDCYMTEKLDNDCGECDIYYYFEAEEVPEVGGTWEQDGDVWERIA